MKKKSTENKIRMRNAAAFILSRDFKYAWAILLPLFLLTVLSGFVPAVNGYITRELTNDLVEIVSVGASEEMLRPIGIAILALFGARVLPSVIGAASGRLNMKYQEKMELSMTKEVTPFIDRLSSIAYHSEDFRSKRKIFASNGQICELTFSLTAIVSQIAGIAAASVACLSIHPWILIVPAAVIPYTWLSVRFTHDYMERVFRLMTFWNRSAALDGNFRSSNTLAEIKLFGGGRVISEKLDGIAEEEGRVSAEMEKLYSGWLPLVPVIFVKTIQLFAYLSVAVLIYQGKGTIGDFVLLSSVSYIFSGYSGLANSLKQFAADLAGTAWFIDFVYHNPWTERKPENPKELGPITSVRFEKVCFRYPSREENAVDNLNLDFTRENTWRSLA